ncbi:MAG: hypothetical protein J7L15_04445 [Clostridiales bacterium]|nr:hypothetical protein [Clostridiales bacterium]
MDKIINVDLDGTICDFEYPSMGKLKKGVIEALQKLKDDGFYIRIFSCRTSEEVLKYPIDRQEQKRKMEQYLDENEVPYDEVLNINKPIGIFIDDKAIGFRDNWAEVVKEVYKL